MPKKLLLLGTGGIAGHHITEFAAIPECKIVACVDSLPGRAEAFASANGIARAFDGLDAALGRGEFDAAINCTPDGVHMATTLALIAAGKHVFCEKPIALSAADVPDPLKFPVAVQLRQVNVISAIAFPVEGRISPDK